MIDDGLAVSAATADVSADIIPGTVTLPGGVQQPLHPSGVASPAALDIVHRPAALTSPAHTPATIDLGVPGLSTRISAAASTPTHAEVLSAQRTRSGHDSALAGRVPRQSEPPHDDWLSSMRRLCLADAVIMASHGG